MKQVFLVQGTLHPALSQDSPQAVRVSGSFSNPRKSIGLCSKCSFFPHLLTVTLL